VYRLIGFYYARWIAVAVTVLLALNARFVSLATEILTDVPFLFGLVSALFAWELLWRIDDAKTPEQDRPRSRWRAMFILVGGLGVAAMMRPTFWVVAFAWSLVCAWGLIRGPRRRFYLLCLTALLVVWAAMIMVDPRTGKGVHFSPLSGGYEEEAMDTLESVAAHMDPENRQPSLMMRLYDNLPKLFGQHLPTAFMGQQQPAALGVVTSCLLLAGPLFFLRKRPLWAMLVPMTIGVTLVLSTEPRYYVMVAPFLLLGWVVGFFTFTSKLPGGWGDLLLLGALLPVAIVNMTKVVPLTIEQQRVPVWASDRAFYAKYRGGEFVPIIDVANVVREHTTPTDKTLAPSAPVVAYLSDRQVLRQRELLPLKRNVSKLPEYLAKAKPDYVVLPWRYYRDKDPEIARLIQRRVIVADKKLARVDGLTLARARIVIRHRDWRAGPAPKTSSASLSSAHLRVMTPERRAAILRQKARAKHTTHTTHTTHATTAPTTPAISHPQPAPPPASLPAATARPSKLTAPATSPSPPPPKEHASAPAKKRKKHPPSSASHPATQSAPPAATQPHAP
jgi:hypothetical protein